MSADESMLACSGITCSVLTLFCIQTSALSMLNSQLRRPPNAQLLLRPVPQLPPQELPYCILWYLIHKHHSTSELLVRRQTIRNPLLDLFLADVSISLARDDNISPW